MCGIGGIVNLGPGPSPQRDALEQMIAVMDHRGPDERGLYRDARAGLAHTRLAIIDLHAGQQPLGAADGAVWVVLNGEIFNYVELRAELERAGHHFRTHSDTEVAAVAWHHWGPAAAERFNGQWALAVWEPREERLSLSRDRLGIRPLHYAEHAGRVVFGSEVKTLFAGAPDLPRAFDGDGLHQTLTFWSVVAPRTVFRGVCEVRPGHVRTYHRGRITEVPYWSPSFPGDFRGSLADAVDAVRAALDDATRLRMLRADVAVGSYLSGGLDSSVIASLGQRALDGAPLHTFSLRFADAEYDETPYQRLVRDHLGSEHHEVEVGVHDIAAVFPAVVRLAERPLLRTAPAPLLLLSRLVRERGIKVVLTGEGADEVFAGYDLFREGAVRRFWARAPGSSIRPRLLERLYPYLARSPVAQQAMARKFFGRELERWREPGFAHGTRWHTTAALRRLLAPALRSPAPDVIGALLADLPAEVSRWSPLAGDQYLEMRTLLAGYLLSSQGDRMLMGSSVEGRFPFLDHRVVELAGHLPDAFKLRGLDEKHVLKRVAAGLVPPAIVRRPKQPYRAPDALAFVGPDRPAYVDALLDARAIADAGVLDPGAVATLWKKCLARASAGQFSNTDNMALVAALSIQLLHRELIDQRPLPAPARIETVVDRTTPA